VFRAFDQEWFRALFPQARSVALVGNGPSVTETAQGAYIDSFDVVVRMNSYRIGPDQAEYTGRRTDLQFSHLMDTYGTQRLKADGVRGVVASRPASPAFAHNAGLGLMLRTLPRLRGMEIAWISEQVFAELYDLASIPRDDTSGRNPSTGVVALAALIPISGLDAILMTGFDGFPADRPVHHFPDQLYDSEAGRRLVEHCHPTQAEHHLIRTLLAGSESRAILPEGLAGRLGLDHRVRLASQTP
jgi:hypothetical protein